MLLLQSNLQTVRLLESLWITAINRRLRLTALAHAIFKYPHTVRKK